MIFTDKRGNCPAVTLNNKEIPLRDNAKYLVMHLDRRITWKGHLFIKSKQLELKLYQLYWNIGRKSQFPLENKLLAYKVILKPIWTYEIQLWGLASNLNI